MQLETKHTKRTQRDYSMAFKLSVVEQVEKGEFSYKEAQRHYGIQGRTTVLMWLRKHGRQDWSKGISSCARGANREESHRTLLYMLEQRINELEIQLQKANHKAHFLEAALDVLNEEKGGKCR